MAIKKNDIWKLAKLPKGKKVINVKWIHETKQKQVDPQNQTKARWFGGLPQNKTSGQRL